MTFRLKDKNLQVQLDALSDGDFSKRLQHANHDDGMIFVEFGEKLESPGFDLHRFNLAFFDDEVKEIHRYNPHGWNAFPEVEPPQEDVDESRGRFRRRENVPLRRSLRSRRGLRRLRMVE